MLRELAAISTGYLARQRLKEAPSGPYRLLQMRDLTGTGQLQYSTALRPAIDQKDLKRFSVGDGDVLIVNRGENLRAAEVITPPDDTYASAHFFIVRPKKEVLPGYLTWFMNSPEAQNYFRKHQTGTAVRTLSKQALEELPVPTLPIELQQKIIKLAELNKIYQEVTRDLQKKIDLLVSTLSFNLFKKE